MKKKKILKILKKISKKFIKKRKKEYFNSLNEHLNGKNLYIYSNENIKYKEYELIYIKTIEENKWFYCYFNIKNIKKNKITTFRIAGIPHQEEIIWRYNVEDIEIL